MIRTSRNWVVAFISALSFLIVTVDFLADFHLISSRTILNGPFEKKDGFCFLGKPNLKSIFFGLLTYPTQNENNPHVSLKLFYEHQMLGPGNSSYRNISLLGNGAYSYWNGELFFSLPGNPTNPPDKITIEYFPRLSWTSQIFFMLLGIISIFYLLKSVSIPFSFFRFRDNEIFLVVSLFLFFILSFISLIDIYQGTWNHDSSYFLKRMYLLALGYKLYDPVPYMYTSLPIHIGSWLYAKGLSNITLTFAIPFLVKMLNAVLTVVTCYFFIKRLPLALIFGAMYLIFNFENQGAHFTLEHSVVFFLLLVNLVLISMQRSGWLFGLLGFLVGLGGISKQIGFIGILPVLAIIFDEGVDRRKRCLWLIIGCLLAVVLFLCLEDWNFLAIKAQLFDYFRVNLKIHNEYSAKFLIYEPIRAPFSTFLFFIALASVAMLLQLEKNKKYQVVALLLTLGVLLGTRYIRDFPHYSLNLWPYLLLAQLIVLRRDRRLVKWATFFFALASLIFLARELRKFNYFSSDWQRPSVLLDLLIPAGQRVHQISQPNESVLQIGAEEIIEVVAERLPQDMRLLWDTPYKEIPLDSRVVVLFNYGQTGADEKYDELIKCGYEVDFERSLYGMKLKPVVTVFLRRENKCL